MFIRDKFKIWLFVIAIALIITLLRNLFVFITTDNNTYFKVYVESNESSLITKRLNLVSTNKLKIKNNYEVSEDTSFIITDHNDSLLFDNYIKLENEFFTPIVMFVNSTITQDSDGFIELEGSKTHSFSKDLYIILESMEKNKLWADIGVTNKNLLNGYVSLVIPNERSIYYDYIVDLFYITLNENKVPTDIEKKNLTDRVNNLLSKCKKVEDIGQYMSDIYNSKYDNDVICLGPESISSYYYKAFINSRRFIQVYPTQTISIYYDAYVKNTDESKNAFNILTQSASFLSNSGLRTLNRTEVCTETSNFYRALESVPIIRK